MSRTESAAIRAAVYRKLAEHERGETFQSDATAAWHEDPEVAYAVQDEYVSAMCAQRGTSVVGYKIGLTSQRMQEFCGIAEPISGQCLGDTMHRSGDTVSLRSGTRIGLECEIAVLVGKDVTEELRTIDAASGVVDAVAPAFELIDDRNADYDHLDACSLIADNSWHAGIVLGTFQYWWEDLVTAAGEVRRGNAERRIDPEVIGRGTGGDILGHPLLALCWLTKNLSERGIPLRAGSVVLTGSMATTYFPDPGDEIEFRVAGVGDVAISFLS